MAPTAKQIAANQRRSLRSLTKKLFDMSADWGDIDLHFQTRLDWLGSEAANLEKEMSQFILDGGNDDHQ